MPPWRTRERMSLPLLSVPKGCAALGASLRWSRSIATGSGSGRRGAAADPAHRTSRIMRTALPLLAIEPDPRVETVIKDVCHKVDQYKQHGAGDDAAEDDGVVALGDAFHGEPADSVPAEDRLGDNRAVEIAAEVETDDRDNRNDGVLDHMNKRYPRRCQALRPGRVDMGHVEDL